MAETLREALDRIGKDRSRLRARGEATDPLDAWIWRAGCSITRRTTDGPEVDAGIMRVAIACHEKTLRGEATGIFHEAAIEFGYLDRCGCVPCMRAREQADRDARACRKLLEL